MAGKDVITCTSEDIDISLERWQAITSQPDLCQQFPCSEPADRECGWCRSLFCANHALHDCIRGQRRIDEYGVAA
jgi:hypothetical protein